MPLAHTCASVPGPREVPRLYPAKRVIQPLCPAPPLATNYVWPHIHSKSNCQPGEVVNPARGQLNRED